MVSRVSVGDFSPFYSSKPPSQLTHPLHFNTIHTPFLHSSHNTLSHTNRNQWAFATFSLPPRSDSLWIVRICYSSKNTQQLIVGIVQESQNSGLSREWE